MRKNYSVVIMFMPIVFLLFGCLGNEEGASLLSQNDSSEATIFDGVMKVASYLDEIPYLSKSSTIKKAISGEESFNFDGIPQDEDGYYDLTNPVPKYLDSQDFSLPNYIFKTYDELLDEAKNDKNIAIHNCPSLNAWCYDGVVFDNLILFDTETEKLTFCRKENITRTSSFEKKTYETIDFKMANVYKDDNGKINYQYSKCNIYPSITEFDPVRYQTNVSYLEDSYYVYSSCGKDVNDFPFVDQNDVEHEAYTTYTEGFNTYYMDLSNSDIMYSFSFSRRYTLEGELVQQNVEKAVFDNGNRVSVEYSPRDGVVFSLFDNDLQSAITIRNKYERIYLNLYDFDGWDYFLVNDLTGTSFTRDYKFKLSNNNVNDVVITPGLIHKTLYYNDGIYFGGYPNLMIDYSDYESFKSYLDLAGLKYLGKDEDLLIVKKFFESELDYEVFDEKIADITDEKLIEYVLNNCKNYKYFDIADIIDYNGTPIPFSSDGENVSFISNNSSLNNS